VTVARGGNYNLSRFKGFLNITSKTQPMATSPSADAPVLAAHREGDAHSDESWEYGSKVHGVSLSNSKRRGRIPAASINTFNV
jgi:hypothetical protein